MRSVVSSLLLLAACTACRSAVAAPLQAFRLTWNEPAVGLANLSGWQEPITTSKGWVTVSADGHYSYDGKRLRFLGVNITADDCFPPSDRADGHASRLASFGFNSVRFHHMEAPWAKSSVLTDYASGSSRNVSASRLDRLHTFVATLAQRGIFSDINLLVSREFQAADGLGSEITQLGWKDQHILGFFSEAALALHKEWADRVLTVPNPHRSGLSLAQDPAVAVVEIMNENGFVQKWHEGVVDTLPSVYAAQLESKWNTWLHAKYASSATMLQAWGALNEPLGANFLLNADFSGGTTNWSLEQHNGAVASVSVVSDYSGQPAAKIIVTTPGSAGWHVQFNQRSLSVQQGATYTVSFWAKAASASQALSTTVMRADGDYAGFTNGLNLTLGTSWKQYAWTFQSTGSSANARVNFGGLGSATGTVWIADVCLQAGGKIGGLPDGKNLEASNVPQVRLSGGDPTPTLAQRKDWIAFMLACEREYWEAMKTHLKSVIGYKGIVWGTIISNSPPNEQTGLDALDTHSYWQHPVWPAGLDWDPEQWTLQNISMVNDASGGVLGTLALQRGKGMPLNVTEYQHCSPNTYASEAPLLAAAYGALQDWDGIWMFEYNTDTSDYITGYFDTGGHPGKMANNLIAAAIFRRGDVSRARRQYLLAFSPETELDLAATKGSAWSIASGNHLDASPKLALESRFALALGNAASEGITTMPAAPSGPVLSSDNGELVWDNSVSGKGVMTVNAARTKAVIGFVGSRSFELGGVTIAPGTTRQDWCTVGISLMSGESFDHPAGGRALIVTTGDIENTGMVWKDSTRTSVGRNWGSSPTLIEMIPCAITLPVAASRVSAWALDAQGQRGTSLAVTDDAGKARLNLGSSGSTLWYEVEIAAGEKAAPSISGEPMSSVVKPGEEASFEVVIDGYPSPSVQWMRNGVELSGATSPRLTIPAAGAADAGTYTARVSNEKGSVTTHEVVLAIDDEDASKDARLVALATRGWVGTGDLVMISGFVVEGRRDVLVGATGPGLKLRSGIPDALMDPKLELWPIGASAPSAVNDDWNRAELEAIVKQMVLGVAEDKEACLRAEFPSGPFTVLMKSADDQEGVGLLELYDTGLGASGRMHALASRALAGTGDASLMVGFVIQGQRPGLMLVRALGPSLQSIIASPTVADPTITLHKFVPGGVLKLRSNDDWGDYDAAAAVRAACVSSWASAMPENSCDSTLLLWLEPGSYSAVMSAKEGSALGMIEVYQVR